MDLKKVKPNIVLNATCLFADWDAQVRVGLLDYVDQNSIIEAKKKFGVGYVVKRRGAGLEVAAQNANLPINSSELVNKKLGDIKDLVAARLFDWLIEHFSSKNRRIIRKGNRIILVSSRPEDDLLRKAIPRIELPFPGIRFQAAYNMEVRKVYPGQRSQVFLSIDSRSCVHIDTSVNELMAAGVSVGGLYVRRRLSEGDPRLDDFWRLAGRIESVNDQRLKLTDHDEGLSEVLAKDVRLEPRIEVLADIISQLCPKAGSPHGVLEKLRIESGRISRGDTKLSRIRSLAKYLSKQRPILFDGHIGQFRDLVQSKYTFPENKVINKPSYIFNSSGSRTHYWSQGGLDRHGPYDRYQFEPKKLNVVVLCQQNCQGRVEQFVEQFFNGVPNTKGGEVGFLRRFALEKPYVHVFTVKSAAAKAYRDAAISAVEYITDKDEVWNLAIVQIEEAMEAMDGENNPYLVTKAFFLTQRVAVQHVHLETMNQSTYNRAYSLNNIGLASYAKLGGVPWLLPSSQTVAHELVIGIGSHHVKKSRFGVGDRYVGITTLFTGDGRYLLESRTKAVPFNNYSGAMFDAVRAGVERVRSEFAWSPGDPVRLIFHAFKPMKDIEARTVHELMAELAIPHAEYAFLHLADAHPYQLFNENEKGQQRGSGLSKGVMAPPRGLMVHLSRQEALLCLKGARELKQESDGHPSPLLLRLHRDSSFRDLTYLGQQAYAFSCHSWRSFFPAPVPITILYSQLVANGLRELSMVAGWSEDAIVGRIGRTRWFL